MSRRLRVTTAVLALLAGVLALAGVLWAAPGVRFMAGPAVPPGALVAGVGEGEAPGTGTVLPPGPGGQPVKPPVVNGVVVEVQTIAPRSITLRLGMPGPTPEPLPQLLPDLLLEPLQTPEPVPHLEPLQAQDRPRRPPAMTFPVADEAVILVKGQSATLGDVLKGFQATLVLDAQGRAVVVAAWAVQPPEPIVLRGWLVKLPPLPSGQASGTAVQHFGLVPVDGVLPGKGAGPAGRPVRPQGPLHVVLLLPGDPAVQAEMQSLVGRLVGVKGKWVESPIEPFGRAFEAGELEALPWPPVGPAPKPDPGPPAGPG